MRENPRVCVAIDDIADQTHWTSVVVFGRYEELSDVPQQSAALDRARELFEQRATWWLPAAGKLASGQEHGSSVIYRVRIDHVTGRRAARPERVASPEGNSAL